MKIQPGLLVTLILATLLAAGCSSNARFTLTMTLEPSGKNLTTDSNTLSDAAEIIKKRLNNFGIEDGNLKAEVLAGRIIINISRFDTTNTLIVENLATIQGRIGFWETYENKDILGFMAQVNNKLSEMKVLTYTPEILQTVPDKQKHDTASGGLSLEDILKPENEPGSPGFTDTAAIRFKMENPLFGIMVPQISSEGEPLPSCLIGLVNEKDTSQLNSLLKMNEIAELFPYNLKFFWSRYPYKYDESKKLYELHAIKVTTRDGKAPIEGDVIASAKAEKKGSEAVLGFSMNLEGAKMWSRMTKENIDRCIAVIIDGYVRSYPRVMNEITEGKTEITGDFSMAEARYLSFILNSGGNGLPLDLRIAEEKISKSK